jgi:hypothetical protein
MHPRSMNWHEEIGGFSRNDESDRRGASIDRDGATSVGLLPSRIVIDPPLEERPDDRTAS